MIYPDFPKWVTAGLLAMVPFCCNNQLPSTAFASTAFTEGNEAVPDQSPITHVVDSAEQLHLSVRRMNQWLGSGKAAEGWRRVLMLNALETETALGYSASPQMLERILKQFEQKYDGLDSAPFVDVRNSLHLHLQSIKRVENVPLESLIASARGNYRKLDADDLLRSRDDLLWNLELMQKQYLETMTSEDRAVLYNELDLKQIIEDLKQLDPSTLVPSDTPVPDKTAEEGPKEDLPKQDNQAADAGAERTNEDRQVAEQERNENRTRLLRSFIRRVQAFDKKTLDQTDVWMLSSAIAMERFFRVAAAVTSTQNEREFNQSLDTIEANLPLLVDSRNRLAAVKVGDALNNLAHSLQAHDLVAAVKRRFAQPNARVDLSSMLVTEEARRSNADTFPVEEVILGRLLVGTATSYTDVNIELMDDPSQVAASIHLLGTVNSRTTSRTGPVTAFSGSIGAIEGRRNLFANVGGFYSTEPYAAANVNSSFDGVDCRLRIVQRIAEQTYWRDKQAAEGIGAARMEGRVAREFEEQTDTALTDARGQLSEFQPKIYNLARWVPDVAVNSMNQRLNAIVRKTDPSRLGAAGSAPQRRINSDIRIALHQSMISNYIDPLFAGQQLSNKELGELAEKLTGEFPEAFKTADPSEDWAIIFPPTGAVSFDLHDQKLGVEITGRRFSQGERRINAELIIRFEFMIGDSGGEINVRQIGRPVIAYADESQMDGRVVAFKNFLEKKLGEGYDPATPVYKLPANLIPADQIENERILERVRNIDLVEFRIEDGWLLTAWNRKTMNPYEVDFPALRSSAEIDSLIKAKESPSVAEAPAANSATETAEADSQ